MKIAIATLDKKPDSQISQQAGRSSHYLVFNENGKVLETLNNPFARGGGGAGFAVIKMLQEKDVNVIVAGKFGPNMISAMDSAGIKYYKKTGIAQEVVKEVGQE